jgi:hypothetical protein
MTKSRCSDKCALRQQHTAQRRLQERRAPTAAATRWRRHDASGHSRERAPRATRRRRCGILLERCSSSSGSGATSATAPRAAPAEASMPSASRLLLSASTARRTAAEGRSTDGGSGCSDKCAPSGDALRTASCRSVELRLQRQRDGGTSARAPRRCCPQAHSSSDAAATAPAGSNGSPRASADCCGSAAEGGRLPHAPRERGPPHCSRGHSSQRAVACASASQQGCDSARHTHTHAARAAEAARASVLTWTRNQV